MHFQRTSMLLCETVVASQASRAGEHGSPRLQFEHDSCAQELIKHWEYHRQTRWFTRSAGYVRASEASKSFDDPANLPISPRKVRNGR